MSDDVCSNEHVPTAILDRYSRYSRYSLYSRYM